MKNIKGYVNFVLHAHLPYVHHPESDTYLEEEWLFEAISETYIPLLLNFQKLEEAGYIKCNNSRYISNSFPCIDICSVTYQGHQFLDNIRDDKIFNKTNRTL